MSAREFFEKKAFAAVGACTGCHGGGSASAPKFLDGQVGTAYTYLEAHGYIGPESRLLSQGTHGGGSASGLSAENKGVMRQWLALEATERGAKFGKQSLLGRVAECMDETQFRNIGLQTLLTQARPGEDPDYCTGCNQTSCSSCHGDVRTPFYMQLGSALGDDTFAMTKKSPYLGQYITLDGLEPVASRGLEKKQTLVNGQPVYGPHPNFKIRADVKTRLDAFVADTLGKFKQGTCGKAVE
jgi:mono/diheme cytochrome c family protein